MTSNTRSAPLRPKSEGCGRARYGGAVFVNETTEPLIVTPRLELHHLSVDELLRLFHFPADASIYRRSDLSNARRVLVDDRGPLERRVPQVTGDPTLNKWFVRWIVLASTREIIGSTSFHGAPDRAGMIEIGLGVHPDWQGQGIGPEALIGMWSWVCDEPSVRTLRYTVSAANRRSVRLIERLGFAHQGVQLDDVDGPEEIFEMSVEEFRERHATDWRTGESRHPLRRADAPHDPVTGLTERRVE